MPAPLPIAPLFPLGGPVPSDLMIGRDNETAEVLGQIREGISTLVAGPRRIGKTTVCQEVCRRSGDDHGALVVKVDVPERQGNDATALLQQIVDGCAGLHVGGATQGVLKLLRPTIEKWLTEYGMPLDLTGLDARQQAATVRQVIGLPLRVAREQRRRVVLFFDELQRVVDYVDSHAVLTDIRDIYSGAREHAVVLVDGSNRRSIERLLSDPHYLGKLVSRYDLPTTIPAYLWQQPLTKRFAAAGLDLGDDQRDTIIAFGEGRPYDTMAVARYTALAARQSSSGIVTDFDVEVGLDRARQHLDDDEAA